MSDTLSRSFENCFLRVDDRIVPHISSVSKKDYYFEILVENAAISRNSEKLLAEFFGGISCSAFPVENTQNVTVRVSRVKLPQDSYSFMSAAKHIYASREEGWFLGVGLFGPVHLPPSQFTHFALFGTSGFGKSVMLKNLLAQTLAFQTDAVNLIIDFKRVDFQILTQHPRVVGIVNDIVEAKGALLALNIELAYREMVFTKAFSNPPVNLQEYREFREGAQRKDIPDFPRIFVWIDEAKLFFHNEFENEFLTPLIRKGRAFGIHFIFSSQRPSDIPSTFLSQIPETLSFYLSDQSGSYAVTDRMPMQDLKAIRGRFYYYNANTAKSLEAHAPLLSSEEAAGVAFAFNRQPIDLGFSRFRLSESVMKNGYFARVLAAGVSFETAARMDPKQLEEYIGYSGRKAFNFDFSIYHDIVPEGNVSANSSGCIVPASQKAAQREAPASEEDILAEFAALLGGEDKNESKTLKNKEMYSAKPAALAAKEMTKSSDSHLQALLKIPVTDNKKNLQDLLEEFKLRFKESHLDFQWLLRDLSENAGLQRIYDRKLGRADLNNLQLDLQSVAMDPRMREQLQQWVSQARQAILEQRPFPMFVVSGFSGYGKKTLVEVLARELGLLWRKATAQDLDQIHRIDSPIAKELQEDGPKAHADQKAKVNAEKEPAPPEIIMFENLEAAITYSRHRQGSNGVFCLIEFGAGGNLWGESPEKILRKELRHCSEPYLHVEFTKEYYANPVVGDQLIRTLLEHKGFVSETREFGIAAFAKVNIDLNPAAMSKVIDRARRFAFFGKQDFNATVLTKVLEELKANRSVKSSASVVVIEPRLGLKDLILNKDVVDQFSQILLRGKNMGTLTQEFAKKLRRGQRLVTLFYGEPGTGKSMAGEVLAKELGKELWLCEMGAMQSMFVGGTEALLSEMFSTAQAAEAVLQLDEADAFLSNRSSNESDYMRRISNHLLNLIENYRGLLVLTTNHADNLDPAFGRRIDVKVLFSRPDEESQYLILKSLLEPDAPLAPDVDLKKALKGMNLTGGLLRNAVERILVKLSHYSEDLITQEILEESLQEVAKEENALKGSERRQISLS